MKRTILLFLCLLWLAACVPTPEQEFVMNKTEGRLEGLIEEDAVEAYAPEGETTSLRSRLGAPERFTDQYSGHIWGGTLEVVFDAFVELPDVSRVPVYTIAFGSESPEQTEQTVRALLGGGPYCEPNGALSAKLAYEREILHYNEWLNAYENGAFPANDRYAYDAETMRDDRAYALRQLQTLEIGPMQPWTGSFDAEILKIANERNDCVQWFRLSGDAAYYIEYRSGTVAGPNIEYMLPASKTDEERSATKTAEAFIRQIYDGDLKPIGALHLKDDGVACDFGEYQAAFMPVVDGIPVTPYYDNNTGSDTAKQAAGVEDDSARPVPHPYIAVCIGDGTVTRMEFRAPFSLQSTENENVQLLPFAKILDTFKAQIFRSLYLDAARDGEPERTYRLRITGVELCYTVARKPDSDLFYLLPVWQFYGSAYDSRYPDRENDTNDPAYRWWPILTVNAVDGRILHLHSGC
jgi:hypothetical protein